jgi:hypothetical protein
MLGDSGFNQPRKAEMGIRKVAASPISNSGDFRRVHLRDAMKASGRVDAVACR